MITKAWIPKKSPKLLLRMIDDDFGFVVNCAIPHSLRILTKAQVTLLTAIDNQHTTADLATQFGIPGDAIEAFLAMLAKTEIIHFENPLSNPIKPNTPKQLNFWIHTTNACNLQCGYCYISTLNTGGRMPEAVQKQLLKKLIETVQRKQIQTVKFRLAGGEPLSQFKAWREFIPKAKNALKEVGCRLECAFLTNLTILNDDILDFSIQHHLTYGVSLDGVGEKHDATRTFRSGAGSFQIVDAHIRKLLAHHIPVSVNTVVSNQNLAGLSELTRYLIDLNVPFRYSLVKGEVIDAVRLDKHLSAAFTLMQEAIETGWPFTKKFQFCDLKPTQLGFQTCASGFSGGAIYVDGSFHYCHVHFGHSPQTAYTIFDEEQDLVDLIEQGTHYEESKSEDCQQCRYRYICTSGCPVYRINGKDPQCSLYHTFIPLYYELAARERLKLLRVYRKIG